MRTRFYGMVTAVLFLMLSFGCNSDKKEVTKDGQAIKVEEGKEGIPSVCIWDKATVKSEPVQKGKFVSSMALGEKILCMGEEKIDASDKDRKYFKVKLSDGKEGWVSEFVIAIKAEPAVVVTKTQLYLRPDPLTVTDKELFPMDFVALFNVTNEWGEVCGKENKLKGWIKVNTVTTKDVDVAVAILAGKALKGKDTEMKKDKLEKILDNPAYASTVFTDYLSNELSKLWPSAPARHTEAEEDSTSE